MGKEFKFDKEKGNLVFTAVMLFLGVFVFVYSYNYSSLNPMGAHGVGPRLFPQLAGLSMALVSATNLFMAWRQMKQSAEQPEEKEYLLFLGEDIARVLIFIAAMLIYARILMPIIGFVPATAAVTAFLMFLLKADWSKLIFSTFLVTGCYWLLFIRVLRLPFP